MRRGPAVSAIAAARLARNHGWAQHPFGLIVGSVQACATRFAFVQVTQVFEQMAHALLLEPVDQRPVVIETPSRVFSGWA